MALLRGVVEAGGHEVVVAHLDHGLRADSTADAGFVESLARTLGLELLLERADVAAIARERGWNLEDAARRLRYSFLNRAAKRAGADALLTGHTLDDQAETVLMQLLRGAAYLRGMPAVSRQHLRPLLDVAHGELVEYLQRIDQTWREDATNADTRRLRAWLRHEVMPLLGQRFPRTATRLGQHAEVQQRVAAFVREAAERLTRDDGFDQDDLLAAHPAVQREAVRLLIDRAGVAPDGELIERVVQGLERREPDRVSLSPGMVLRLAYGRLEIAREAAAREPIPVSSASQLPAGVPDTVLAYPDLMLRSREPGDRMRLSGGSKSLARLLIDRKIPREERDALQVLASGKKVLWAEGIGPAAEVGDQPDDPERRFMECALELARRAAVLGELPVGAVVVHEGAIVGEAHNETESRRDPSAHAEILAMRRAAERLGDWRLSDCTLYVTLEPCPMCAGAALIAHLERVVFAASNKRDGALGSVTDIREAGWKRRLGSRGGLMAAEAGTLLSRFFAERRS